MLESPEDGQAAIDAEDEELAALFQERRRESAEELLEPWHEVNG
jgi:hypothetical protein